MSKLDPPVAPAGLSRRLKALPFAGRLVCGHTALEAGAMEEIWLDYEAGSGGIADGRTFKAAFKFFS